MGDSEDGSIDPVYHAANVDELAVEKSAATLLVPISTRKKRSHFPGGVQWTSMRQT